MNFANQIGRITSVDQIPPLLEDAIREFNFRYFALVHHVRFTGTTSNLAHFTNYPAGWTERILGRHLYLEAQFCSQAAAASSASAGAISAASFVAWHRASRRS